MSVLEMSPCHGIALYISAFTYLLTYLIFGELRVPDPQHRAELW